MTRIDILNKTKMRMPKLPFSEMKEAVLGKTYELSLVFVGKDEIRKLNKIYRNKNIPTDILSFPLSENSGEIFINPHETRTMAGKSGRTFSDFTGFLFIHGLLHLKGMSHGSTMEKEEEKFCKKFDLQG